MKLGIVDNMIPIFQIPNYSISFREVLHTALCNEERLKFMTFLKAKKNGVEEALESEKTLEK